MSNYTEFACPTCGMHVEDPNEIIACVDCQKDCCINCIVALVDDQDLCDECADAHIRRRG